MIESRKPVVQRIRDGTGRRLKTMPICFIFLFAALATFLPSESHSGLEFQTKNTAAPIRLILETSKRRYIVGEPIEVIGYLENRGSTPFYVGNALAGFFGTTELHELQLRVFAANKKEVWIGHGGGSWIWKRGTTINEKLCLAYTHLQPGTIFGLNEQLPIKLKPGRYRLRATYREIEALSWSEADRKALSIPVWTRPLISNTVTITVSR